MIVHIRIEILYVYYNYTVEEKTVAWKNGHNILLHKSRVGYKTVVKEKQI